MVEQELADIRRLSTGLMVVLGSLERKSVQGVPARITW